jgi:outer membrane protein TolC
MSKYAFMLSFIFTSVSGCAQVGETHYIGKTDAVQDDVDQTWYRDRATQIDWPNVGSELPEEVSLSGQPRTLLHPQKDQIRDMPLGECLRLGLENSTIIRSKGAFLSAGNPILSNPNGAPSFYDPAIQETGVLFGGKGVEAALSEFDAQFATTTVWGRNEQIRNNAFIDGVIGNSVTESGSLESSLSKTFGFGGQFELQHNVAYTGLNIRPPAFPSVYSGNVSARYRHPLLAGAGAEFTRIAGPIANAFGGLTGVTQGVVIARINHDVALSDLEQNVTGLVRDIEYAYWELYLQYRTYDTVVAARNSAHKTWDVAKKKLDVGGIAGFSKEDEAQARDQYFLAQARSQEALSQLYKSEAALRRLIVLPVNDGAIIRPSDEPVTSRLEPDWPSSVASGLTNRVELRRHKWNIKSLELQHKAAQSLVRPRLDFIGSYSINGFGDRLLDYDDGVSEGRPSNMYGNLVDGDQTGWSSGFVLQMPLGLRSARAQVQNIELRLSKARDVLAAQEQEIAHEIGFAFQELAEKYVTTQTYLNRRLAAEQRADLMWKNFKGGTYTLDLFLRAQASLAEAEVAYYQALVEYNLAAVDLQYRQGTLLRYSNIYMAEGEWDAEAWNDAHRRASARAHGFDASSYLHTEPEEFVLPRLADPWPESDDTIDEPDIVNPEQPASEPENTIPRTLPEPLQPAPDSKPAPPQPAPLPGIPARPVKPVNEASSKRDLRGLFDSKPGVETKTQSQVDSQSGKSHSSALPVLRVERPSRDDDGFVPPLSTSAESRTRVRKR